MKNPFSFFRGRKSAVPDEHPEPVPAAEAAPEPDPEPVEDMPETADEEPAEPGDGFTEWCRSRPRGGIERRERNDIYESYFVYGVDRDGRLTCRCYHRYPEHERDFGLSYSRALSFDDFDRRLLSELDRGGIKLGEYDSCIALAVSAASDAPEGADGPAESRGFSDGEYAALNEFCESMDIVRDRSYLHGEGVYSCECFSAVGEDRLNIRFRKLLRYDAAHMSVAGVSRTPCAGYDIGNLWIMGVYNRVRDNCASCTVEILTSEWSVDKESLYLITADGFAGIDGRLLIAVGEADSFRRFGFYSLDFSNK